MQVTRVGNYPITANRLMSSHRSRNRQLAMFERWPESGNCGAVPTRRRAVDFEQDDRCANVFGLGPHRSVSLFAKAVLEPRMKYQKGQTCP